jgi:methionyl-tRNA formyltransferase
MGISGKPGMIFEKYGMLLLACQEGALEIERAQWDGKKEMDAASILNGLRGRGIELPLVCLMPEQGGAA